MLHKWENCLKLDKYSWGYRRNIRVKTKINLKFLIFLKISLGMFYK